MIPSYGPILNAEVIEQDDKIQVDLSNGTLEVWSGLIGAVYQEYDVL